MSLSYELNQREEEELCIINDNKSNTDIDKFEYDIKLNNDKSIRGEHIFICKLCSKEFTYRKVFERHFLKHKTKTNSEKLFQCKICSKTFFSQGFLSRHLKMHDRKDKHIRMKKELKPLETNKNNSPYSYLFTFYSYNKNKCLICNKSNINNTERLIKHLKRHI